MKRTCFATLVVVSAALGLGAIGASPAVASECFHVDNPAFESGNFETKATCEKGEPLDEGGNWFKGTADRDEFLPCVKVQLDLNFIIGYTSLAECQKESTTPGVEWLMASPFIILEPLLFVEEVELEDLGGGEKKPVKFAIGEMKLTTKSVSVTCKKGEGTGTAIGGTPGTGKATLKLKECEVAALKCKVMNKGGTAGTIEFNANVEDVSLTKVGLEEGLLPYALLFKTHAKGEKTLVELALSEPCASKNGPVTATGEEHGAGIEGVAAFVCKLEAPEESKEVHELTCAEKEQTVYFYGKEGKTASEGKAGIEVFKEKAEQVGKAKIELESKAKWGVVGI
jgi:hypothetical protein